MSCENILKDVCHIHARLFDHTSASQGHIKFFAREFEDKRGDREKQRLDTMQEVVRQCHDHTLPNVHHSFNQHLQLISDRVKQATEACKSISETAERVPDESEFLRSQRLARQQELTTFMEQQCVRSERVDQQFDENVALCNTTFEDLSQQLTNGIPFSSQTYYKFMALGKEFS